MAIILKSTEAQQNFGSVVERLAIEDDIIVDCYGSPCVAIVNYRRYQALVAAEKELIRHRLQQASATASARAAVLSDTDLNNLIQETRTEANNEVTR
jgi:hypothetical protein